MQRKGNLIRRKSQGEKVVSVGIDMGGNLWATDVRFWDEGRESYFGYKDDQKGFKEEKLYGKVRELLAQGYKVHAYYEAGRYGFTPARLLTALGAEVTVLPVNKLEIIVCGKRVKTDKVDAKFLAGLHPEDDLPRVYIPTVEEEARRGAVRELGRLQQELGRLNAQMLAILEKSELPPPSGHQSAFAWKQLLVRWHQCGYLRKLPDLDWLRMRNHLEELELFEKHLAAWKATLSKYEERFRREAEARKEHLVLDLLQQYTGIADNIARHYDWEIGPFGRFRNGRSFAAFFGLAPVHWASGKMNRDQGISKAGRTSLRKMAIEMAWLWYRWQPECALVKKWAPKLKEKGRQRKTAITALARQLLVALWRYVVYGEEIPGAVMNQPLLINS